MSRFSGLFEMWLGSSKYPKIINGENDMNPAKILDAMMGKGKTSGTITYVNEHPDRLYVFATQYIDECERIRRACPALDFRLPSEDGGVTKSYDLLRLLDAGKNVAITHALLSMFTEEIINVLRDKHYTLILDEAFDVMHAVDITEADSEILLKAEAIAEDENLGSIRWKKENYDSNGKFAALKKRVDLGGVVQSDDGKLMEWMYDPSLLDVYDEIYVLTYMFEYSPLKFYFDMVGVKYVYIGVRKADDGRYILCEQDEMESEPIHLREKIHVLNSRKRNAVGNDTYALSKNWYKRDGKLQQEHIAQMRAQVRGLMRGEWKDVRSSDFMWSCFSDDIRHAVVSEVQGGKRRYRFNGKFVEFSCRAKNEYGDRHYLAYLVNVFLPRALSRLLVSKGVSITKELRDGYATSVMVQWIWRSAIRNGEEIWLYLPSSRMRNLLKKWLDEVEGDVWTVE